MEAGGGVLSAFGLPASPGLNAYSLIDRGARRAVHRLDPARVNLRAADQTFVRPAAGAVLFAAGTNVVTDIPPVVALIAGVLVASGVHLVKSAAVRPAVNVTTGGVANVPVSIAEDLLATILSIAAIIVPVVVAVLLILLTAFVLWLLWRRANRMSEGARS